MAGYTPRAASAEAERIAAMEAAPEGYGAGAAPSTAVQRNFPPSQGPGAVVSGYDPDAAPGAPATDADTGPLSGSINDLKAKLPEITDAGEIETLIAQERAGKNRDGAVAALEARKEELGS